MMTLFSFGCRMNEWQPVLSKSVKCSFNDILRGKLMLFLTFTSNLTAQFCWNWQMVSFLRQLMKNDCVLFLTGLSCPILLSLGLTSDSMQPTETISKISDFSSFNSLKFLLSRDSSVISTSLGVRTEQQLSSRSRCSTPSRLSVPLSIIILITLALIRGHYLIWLDLVIWSSSRVPSPGFKSRAILAARYRIQLCFLIILAYLYSMASWVRIENFYELVQVLEMQIRKSRAIQSKVWLSVVCIFSNLKQFSVSRTGTLILFPRVRHYCLAYSIYLWQSILLNSSEVDVRQASLP